ncbi:MAG: S8 family serine peptidase [Myxococcaceae bacterium]|nr:S8 family serine peptidase [Myxococcaceae bacterium]MBH2005832.1 S8 family serine peptidase [Myxococcaceae bacterium]
MFNIIFLFVILAAPWAFSAEYRAGSILVKRKETGSVRAMSDIHIQAKTFRVRRFEHPRGLELVQVNLGQTMEKALAAYRNDPSIEYAEPNYIVHAVGTPNDPYFQHQWGLNNEGQTGGIYDTDINVVSAWDRFKGSASVVLGVIDTGVDYTHPDLKNNIWTNSLEIPGNGIDDDHNGYIDDVHGINALTGSGDPMDDNQHGTHVAGIMAAEGNNGIGISGVVQKAKIVSCKFLDAEGSGDTAGAITCMNYFAALAKRSRDPVRMCATNNSWGGGLESQAFVDAVRAHQKLGILFVVAASNESNDNDENPSFPSNISLSNVISVAAVDHKGRLASFSNYGKHSVMVAAPGVDILSTTPDSSYEYLSGTSMASPFVAGLAGFIKGAHPDMDWVSLKNLILAGGKPVLGAINTTATGRLIRAIGPHGTGSISCHDQVVQARLLPLGNAHTMVLGDSLKLSLLKIRCAESTQARLSMDLVNISGNLLNDLGKEKDDVAYDGVFNGAFTPKARGFYVLAFPNGDPVHVTVR